MVKVLYKLFLGLMIALFVGFGVAVFYESPKQPDFPVELQNVKNPDTMTATEDQQQRDYENQQRQWEFEFKDYSRTVSGVVIGIAVILLVICLVMLMRVDILGDGVLFGGLFLLGYGLIRAFMTDDSKFQFIIVTVGLVMAVTLGYIKFIRPEKKAATRKR